MKRLILIAKESSMEHEVDMLSILVENGYQITIERDPELVKTGLDNDEYSGAILAAEFHTVSKDNDLNEYKLFMMRYASSKDRKLMGFILFTDSTRRPECFMGWGTLVDAYVASQTPAQEACDFIERAYIGMHTPAGPNLYHL